MSKSRNANAVIAILVLASTASIMSTDLYAPSLPHLPDYFGTSAETVKLTVTLNLLGFALAQLVLGPASDRFGRRPVLLTGLVVFTACSAAAALSPGIGALLAARILQGIAASVEAVVGLAIIRDRFEARERVRALAIWGMAIAITPAAAPILGGYIHVWAGWRANFWLVAAVGATAAWLVWRKLPESTRPDPAALRPSRVLGRYLELLRHRTFVAHATVLGAGLGAVFAFVTAGPFLLIDHYGVPTQHFGLYQAGIVAAFFAGSVVASRLARRVALDRLYRWGLAAAGLGVGVLVGMLLADRVGPRSLTGALSIVGLGLGPIFAVGPARALDALPDAGGAASALLGTAQMGLSAVAAGCVTYFHDDSPRPLILTVLAMAALGALACWKGRLTRAEGPARGGGDRIRRPRAVDSSPMGDDPVR